jgi:hypothetical protein
MTAVIPRSAASADACLGMSAIPIRLPQGDDWKAQNADRCVQLIAEGRDKEAFLIARRLDRADI